MAKRRRRVGAVARALMPDFSFARVKMTPNPSNKTSLARRRTRQTIAGWDKRAAVQHTGWFSLHKKRLRESMRFLIASRFG